jgi:hypothetical protein
MKCFDIINEEKKEFFEKYYFKYFFNTILEIFINYLVFGILVIMKSTLICYRVLWKESNANQLKRRNQIFGNTFS